MNRELTLREKVLLLILIVLVMVLGYFKLLYEPVSDRIARCREDTAQEQLALEQNAVRLAQMEKMEQALADIRAAGGSKAIPVDVRVILATNRNLRRLVERGLFREDLYYRINVVNLYVPPLRERQDSIFPLAQSFLQQYSEKFGVQKCFSPDAKTALLEYSWPGNIRELQHTIEKAVILAEKNVIRASDLFIRPGKAKQSR